MKANRLDRTSIMQHLAVECELDLREFCARFQKMLDLPLFSFDYENETEWGLVEVNNIEYNISRPYELGTLQEWDETVPPGCNFGISLIMYREHPHANDEQWAFTNLVIPIGQLIADEFEVDVYYHRTWLGVGRNVARKVTFYPDAGY